MGASASIAPLGVVPFAHLASTGRHIFGRVRSEICWLTSPRHQSALRARARPIHRLSVSSARRLHLTTGHDAIAYVAAGQDKIDRTAFDITAAQVSVVSDGLDVASLYANVDGGPGFDLALVVTGTGPLTTADLLL